MKKVISILVLLLATGAIGYTPPPDKLPPIVGPPPAAARSITVVTGPPSAPEANHCTQLVADNFNRSSSTTIGGNWVESAGQWAIISDTVLEYQDTVYEDAILLDGQTSTVTQYAKITATSGTVLQTSLASWGFYLRSQNDATPGYVIIISSSGTIQWWRSGGGSAIQSLSDTSFVNPYYGAETACVIVKGTGDNTVISIWRACTESKPFSGGGACTDTAKPCWDSAGDAPDWQLTNNPDVASDTEKHIGLYVYSDSDIDGTYVFDNFYAGSCDD